METIYYSGVDIAKKTFQVAITTDGKKELEFSEKDFPCIHDFAERIRYNILSIHTSSNYLLKHGEICHPG